MLIVAVSFNGSPVSTILFFIAFLILAPFALRSFWRQMGEWRRREDNE